MLVEKYINNYCIINSDYVMKTKGEIYLVKSPNHKVYIGQTIYGWKERWRDHIYDANDIKKDHCKKLNRAIRKYGSQTFYVTVLKKCETLKGLNKMEIFYIKVFDSISNGYNIKEGGRNGLHSKESRLKISKSLKGRPKSQHMRERLSKTTNKSGLPMYVIKIKNGYRVVNHPKQRKNGRSCEKKITHSKYTDDEKLQIALNHLEYLNNL